MLSFLAKATSSFMSVKEIFSKPDSKAVPPLPGATTPFCPRGLPATFRAIACWGPPPPMTSSFMSMPEVAHAGEDHGRAALVGRGDHFGVAHAAAGLDERARARVEQHLDAVAEREEGVGGGDRVLERQSRGLRFRRRQARAVDAAHLPGADAERGAAAAEDDGVGFHELDDAPREQEVAPLRL